VRAREKESNMTLAEVLPMLRNGATVDDVFKIAENKAVPAEAERTTSNVVSLAEVKAKRRRSDLLINSQPL
jgi:hypothetical protein